MTERPAAVHRAALAALVALGVLVGAHAVAVAADPVTVGLSDLSAKESSASGVLTLRSKSSVQVDPGSVEARVDGQVRPVTIQQAPKIDRRAMLVIDTSGSMGSSGMATVRRAVATFIRTAPADVRIGVTTFATTAGVDLAPTLDRAAVQRVVNGLSARGDTSLYAGMQAAANGLTGAGDRSIVLLSDGADTVADNRASALAKTVATLRARGVRTDVVQFKTDDPDATKAIRAFAAVNGGSVVNANDSAGVNAAFETSAKALDTQVKFAIDAGEGLTGTHVVELKGTASGTPFNFKRALQFSTVVSPSTAGPANTATAPPENAAGAPVFPSAVPDTTPWLLWIAVMLLTIAFFVLGWALLTPSLQSRKELRVQSIENYVVGPRTTSRSERKSQQAPASEQLVAIAGRVMESRKSAKGTLALIERADLPFRAGEWLLIEVTSGILGAVLGAVLFRQVGGLASVLAIVVGGVLGLFIPTMFLRFKANRRANAFERQLPDILMLVATSLKSGFGLPQALEAVARDASEPAAKEFSRALAETRIGTDISDALDRMAARMNSTSMHWTVMAIRIQREVGGNLADTLRTTAATLRDREALHRQVLTLSAEGRLSALILIALPIGMFFYMLLVNYDYISRLWTNTIGIFMMLIAIVLLIIGVIWMRRVVKIEV